MGWFGLGVLQFWAYVPVPATHMLRMLRKSSFFMDEALREMPYSDCSQFVYMRSPFFVCPIVFSRVQSIDRALVNAKVIEVAMSTEHLRNAKTMIVKCLLG